MSMGPSPEVGVLGKLRATVPILFIHGMWHASWCWDLFLEVFRAPRFEAVAMDLRDHGKGRSGPARLWRLVLGTYVNDVLREIDKLRQKPILVGHSLGCLLAEIVMAQARPPAIVLLAPTRHEIFARSVDRFRAAHPAEYRRLFWTATMWPPIGTPELCREMLLSPALPEARLREFHGRMQNESFWVAAQLRYGFGPRPAPPSGIPTLVVGGELDRAVLPDDVRAVAAGHGTEAVILPGMGHDLMLEVGYERVIALILGFLRDHSLLVAE